MKAPKVRLRELAVHDKDRLRAWRNHPSVARWMYTDHQISPEEHARWFAEALVDPDRRYWIIEVGDQPCGLINLYDIDRIGREAGFAYYLAEAGARGTGAASWAGLQVLDFAFGELALRTLWAEALIENIASRAYLGSLGFKESEVLRGRADKSEFSGDVVRHVLPAQAWTAARAACQKRLAERGYAD